MRRAVALVAVCSWVAACGRAPAPPPGPLPAGASITPPAEPPARARFALGLPDRPWALAFEWPAAVHLTSDTITDGATTRTLMGLSGRAVLNVRLAPDAEAAGPLAARDRAAMELPVLARSPVETLATWEVGPVACLQFRLPNFRGSPLDRLERHCFAGRDGVLAHATVLWDVPPADAAATLDGWTASLALADRPTPPPAELLAFGRAFLAMPDRVPDAARFLDAAAERWRDLAPADRRWLGVACTDAWLALDRSADAERLLGELLAEGPDGRLAYCRARVAAAEGRLDDWEAHLRAALAASADPEAPLPDPREEQSFYAVPAERFDAVMREIAQGK